MLTLRPSVEVSEVVGGAAAGRARGPPAVGGRRGSGGHGADGVGGRPCGGGGRRPLAVLPGHWSGSSETVIF